MTSKSSNKKYTGPRINISTARGRRNVSAAHWGAPSEVMREIVLHMIEGPHSRRQILRLTRFEAVGRSSD
jgi:hypothetical protein